tara:strand:+ start:380 stop:988 length:609 start_codon:yes stop_codon:yes gene_type:complete
MVSEELITDMTTSKYENDALCILAELAKIPVVESPLPSIVVVGIGNLQSVWSQHPNVYNRRVKQNPLTGCDTTFECNTLALRVCVDAMFVIRKSIFDMVEWFFSNCRTPGQKKMSLCRMLFPYQLNNMMIMMWLVRNHPDVASCLLLSIEYDIPIQHAAFVDLKINGPVRWRDVLFPTFLHVVVSLQDYVFRTVESLHKTKQ